MATDISIPLFDLAKQDKSIQKDIEKAFRTICKTSSFIKGSMLEAFENDFSRFVGARYCIGVASGTDALQLSLHTLGIKPGDEVIVPVNTFIATAYAVLYVGAKPVFVDVDEQTYTIDPKLIEKALTKKTKAIIPVHLYGNPAEMDNINQLAKAHNLFVLEDAAQAHGAQYHNKNVGSLGDLAAFSFYPSKNLGAFGDGGAITTNSEEMAVRLKKIREYGASQKYFFDEIGFNSRLDTIQAAILQIKLQHLQKMNQKRQQIADYYTKHFQRKIPELITPYADKDSSHIYHIYTIRTNRRDDLMQYLLERDIQTGIYYPLPLHLQKALQPLGYQQGDFPVAEIHSKEILSLPIYPGLTKKQQDYIIENIQAFFKR